MNSTKEKKEFDDVRDHLRNFRGDDDLFFFIRTIRVRTGHLVSCDFSEVSLMQCRMYNYFHHLYKKRTIQYRNIHYDFFDVTDLRS